MKFLQSMYNCSTSESSSSLALIIILLLLTALPIKSVSGSGLLRQETNRQHVERNNEDELEEQAVASALKSLMDLLHSEPMEKHSQLPYDRNDFEVPIIDAEGNQLLSRTHRQENDENDYPAKKVLLKRYSKSFQKRTDLTVSGSEEENTCSTLPTFIKVVKEETDDSGNTILSCEQTIEVNKCEGKCSSHLHPSVSYVTGFIKNCMCCRETSMKSRTVKLTHCHTPDSSNLIADSGAGADAGAAALGPLFATIHEPMGCACHKCNG